MVTVWQVDFYRRPMQDDAGQPLWELVVCEASSGLRKSAWCPQVKANVAWLVSALQKIGNNHLPDQLQVFRPQAVSLVQEAAQRLGIGVEATRHVPVLKQFLQERAAVYPTLPGYTRQPYEPVALESPPPVPIPEALWGDRWRFGAIAAGEFLPAFEHKPIPVRALPTAYLPVNIGLSSAQSIPGVIIDGGRVSMRLVQWLVEAHPSYLNYIPGDPDGLLLEAGLVDRWILATFEDEEVKAAARTFQERQQAAKGLHFLLVQPDDSGMTYSGLWLLRREETAPLSS
ncbi:Tab2/Atab2 family RNA-binding protein [Vacuolonema iberomarrocanum]|uniref:Tab2/Atab2 family RNA-binding protein n=1 Tax=Vacuolonema iberomarrocanum TaxID=3454632 RepID=UPI0019F68E61|nr:Tab2/Atab2 family RNA-binding protein [filamentous cyanobacterium LEGE 07170]